ncbi:transposase [Candidatus Bipolaricaulota bacterium]|nr:transposase [Candidatus Bipolaricaulota bacterium]
MHTNFVENAWSLFKRGLICVFHHVSAKWLQEYLDEFAFRYSHRHEKARLIDLVLANC